MGRPTTVQVEETNVYAGNVYHSIYQHASVSLVSKESQGLRLTTSAVICVSRSFKRISNSNSRSDGSESSTMGVSSSMMYQGYSLVEERVKSWSPILRFTPIGELFNGGGIAIRTSADMTFLATYRSHRVRGQKIAVEAFGSTPTKDPRLNIDTAHLMS